MRCGKGGRKKRTVRLLGHGGNGFASASLTCTRTVMDSGGVHGAVILTREGLAIDASCGTS